MKKLLRKHTNTKKSNSATNSTNRNLNLNPRTRGDRRSEIEELRLKNEILNLSNNHTDLEIQDILGMPTTTLYRYKQALCQEQREVWLQTYREGIELRIMHTVRSFNLALRINEEIILDKKQSAKTRMEASDKLVELQLSYIDLIGGARDRDDNPSTKTATVAITAEPRPTTFPTIIDPNDSDKWITDPEWIKENGRRMLNQENET